MVVAELIDINDSVFYRVHRLARLLRRHFAVLAGDDGPGPEQWFLLNKLRRREGQSQVELCEAAFADRPNITRMLAVLERRGFVRREADPDDRRRMLVHLTSAGRDAHDAFARRAESARGRLFADLSPDDLEHAMRTIARLESTILTDLEQLTAD